jgi:predicted Zn-dependent peptidase
VSVVAPSTVAPQIIAALTKSYFVPRLDLQGYKAAAFDLSTQALLNRLDAYVTVNDSLLSALFSDGPEHYPTLDETSLTRLSFASLQAFARRAFRIDNALLVISGSVDNHLLDSVAETSHRADGPEGAGNSTMASQPSEHIIESIVPAAGIGWFGPTIHDDMAATAMDFVADYLFNDRGGLLTTQFAEIAPNITLSGQFVTFRKPGVFLVTALGDGSDRFLPAIETQVHAMAKPMDAAAFAIAREAFISRIEMSQATPQGLAASLGWYDLEGNADYAPGMSGESGKYFRDAWALTPESVAAVAKQYLTAPAAHVRLLSLPGRKAVL